MDGQIGPSKAGAEEEAAAENNKKSNNNGNGSNGPRAEGQGRGPRPRPPRRIIKKVIIMAIQMADAPKPRI